MRLFAAVLALSAIACGATTSDGRGADSRSDAGSDARGGAAGAGDGAGGSSGVGSGGEDGSVALDGSTPDPYCSCAPGPHNGLIYVLSDDAEIWSFDPALASFQKVADARCGTNGRVFSMAVDPLGKAWVLYVDSRDIQTVDLNAGTGCGDPGYSSANGFELFGMAFATESPTDACSRLYALSYDGMGPFEQGAGIGRLGVIDPEAPTPTAVASIDFDGGELTGTGDGRLFAFAGPDPAKLVEYDKEAGTELSRVALSGFSKTTASAFAFFGGDFYFFNETRSAGCAPCIEQTCQADHAACLADPACEQQLACAFNQFDITDDCGGTLPQPVIDCVFSTCLSQCFPARVDRVSQVTRLDFDDSDGNGQAMTLEVAHAPIRIVGAGSSVCVPVLPK